MFGKVAVDLDLVYGHAPAVRKNNQIEDLKLDLYRPAGDVSATRPAVIFVHGGAFIGGTKRSGHDWPLPYDFARRGFVAASIDYRLDNSEEEATDDLQASVRWFKAHAAELGVDPKRIAVMGSSSGAVMALSAAFAPEEPGNSGNPGYSSDVAAGVSISGSAFHPTTITPGDPPIAIIHALDDQKIPYALGLEACGQTQAVTNICELFTYPQGGHPAAFVIAYWQQMVEQTSGFLVRQVGIDTVRPVTTDDVTTAWRTAPVPATLSAGDGDGSGVLRTFYTKGGDPPAPTVDSPRYHADAKPRLADGERIRYFSVDRDGNAEDVHTSRAAQVDSTAPATADDVPAGWQRRPVAVTLSAADSDGGSGVAHTYYAVGANPAKPTRSAESEYDRTAKPVLRDGERVRYFSVDAAGNTEAVHESAAARVDDVAPSSSAVGAARDGATIRVDYTAADSGAGLDRVELYARRPGDADYSRAGTDATPAASGGSFDYDAADRPGDYAFYTVAYDRVGNAEVAPAGPDAVARVEAPPRPVSLQAAGGFTASPNGVVAAALSNPNAFAVTGAVTVSDGGRRALSRAYSLDGGAGKAWRVTLPDWLRAKLARQGHLPVGVTISTRAPGRDTVTVKRIVELRQASARQPGRRR